MAVPWLVHEGRVLATLEVADSGRARSKGLLGRDGIEGAILLRPAKSVHTFGMRFPIDVAFLDRDHTIVRVRTMRPGRLALPIWRARAVVEAEAGSLARWGIGVGDTVDLRLTTDA